MDVTTWFVSKFDVYFMYEDDGFLHSMIGSPLFKSVGQKRISYTPVDGR